MTKKLTDALLSLLDRHKELGISDQIDYDKFYLYSIITHSTAIEGSTVTEDIDIFVNSMTELHCRHLEADIDRYVESIGEKVVDKSEFAKKMVDKWAIKPSLADKLADILLFMDDKQEIKTEDIVSHFGFTATTAKRYLRRLTEFGYLEARGGNKNRIYLQAASHPADGKTVLHRASDKTYQE